MKNDEQRAGMEFRQRLAHIISDKATAVGAEPMDRLAAAVLLLAIEVHQLTQRDGVVGE